MCLKKIDDDKKKLLYDRFLLFQIDILLLNILKLLNIPGSSSFPGKVATLLFENQMQSLVLKTKQFYEKIKYIST